MKQLIHKAAPPFSKLTVLSTISQNHRDLESQNNDLHSFVSPQKKKRTLLVVTSTTISDSQREITMMMMEREKEREMELENAMYSNCLLLGLDPSIIGGARGSNSNGATSRVGLFRHSNPKLGEQLLYFILSSLRGPIQSAKVLPLHSSLHQFQLLDVLHCVILFWDLLGF